MAAPKPPQAQAPLQQQQQPTLLTEGALLSGEKPQAEGRLHRLFQRLHGTQRKFFDSGEHFSAKQGIKLPDLLPGGAPAEACPKKTEPSVYPQRQYRKMDAVAANLTADQIQQPMHKMSCTDY